MIAPDMGSLVATLRAAGCVFAEQEAALLVAAASCTRELETLVAQRVSGEPLEYLLGWTEFRGLRVAVSPGVFVPRQRSGFLVEKAVTLVTQRARAAGTGMSGHGADGNGDGAPCVVVDMCCGCGALGLATATELTDRGIRVELIAADVEPAAVDCARRNLSPVNGQVYQGDLFAPLPPDLAGRVDVLLANTPYVPTAMIGDMPPEARDHEPRIALDGGPDGLAVFRRVAAAAPHWLAPGGHLLVETSRAQVCLAMDILARQGLTPTVARSEELYATVVIGTRSVCG